MDNPKVEPGIYQHFKGKLYEVIGVARKVDTSETFVIYRPLYGDRELVARLIDEFTGLVRRGADDEPRFRQIDQRANMCKHIEVDQVSKSL
ncbi:DUF1653 domain-containing protein [Tautonia sp. JC769]|uniref:DUF1653 domain-containing protein n=1 Tax=Tautonia sp. JC769 TaxID=3232135 RepID=UPI00345B2D29